MFLFPQAGETALIFVLASAFVAGLSRGFSGFGAALIFMPLASSVISPREAAPLLLIVDGVLAAGLIPDAWRRASRRDVFTMAAGAFAGVPLGTVVLALANPLFVRWLVVGIVAALLLLLASGWRYRGRPTAPLTVAVGAISGLFTGTAGSGGPPVIAYWLGSPAGHKDVRANVILFSACSTAASVASYLVGRLITLQVLELALLTAPAYGIGLFAGSRLFGRADEATFRRICYGLIAAAAIVGLPILDPLLR